MGKFASKAIGVHRSVISFAPKNKSPNGRLVLFRGRFTGVQVKACQSPHQLLEKLRSLQFHRGLRVLMALSLAMGLPGCRDEVQSSTYPIGQTGETCTAYKGFDRQPPEVVVAELAKRGLDSRRLVHRTVCGPITSWDILPAGASIDRIPPPDAYVNVRLLEDGSVSVSTDRP
ncbi:hypothetical protein [Stenotrophomonas pavanii]|uniref:hypothetical protein n=2 Tax=Stenotrophomonas pavanii TaxID=487698 RepID=UPI001E61EEC8|nr:hypothetical protein [Stenotrophomonas pavanii]UGB18927.1 hypothetical protein LQ332_06970 [Stenotrophomonas maltophilia]UGB49849.1 hypothetical protein LQ330_01875 [Stenotrophomonas maltophilia]